MSSETSAWAKEQRCGDPVTKAVLMEIANWAKPTGVCEFLSVKRIAEVVEVSARTVQRHIQRLEDKGSLGLIRRLERHRDDGGQGANCFELIGYEQPATAGAAPRRQSVTPPRQIDTPPCQIDGEPGDNGVTRLGDKILPPSDPDGSDTPTRPEKGVRLSENWQPPAVSTLPPMALELVRQWPAGAYEASCETFRLHWLSETRAIGVKRNWSAALGKWLINDHPKVMRDAKAGVSFARLAPSKPSAAVQPAAQPVAAKDREDSVSRLVHGALRSSVLGSAQYDRWVAPCAILYDEPGLIVVTASEFASTFIEAQFADHIRRALRGSTGMAAEWVRFEVERGGNREGQRA